MMMTGVCAFYIDLVVTDSEHHLCSQNCIEGLVGYALCVTPPRPAASRAWLATYLAETL